MIGTSLLLASLLGPAPAVQLPGPGRVRYITLTLSIPVGVNPREVCGMVDNIPYDGVYVVDARDLPGPPKRAHRPSYLPRIPREAE